MIILLADDERMVRLGLKNMLEELYPNTHTYIEAKNGQELIELASQYKPHIAFVDIKMPLLDGLSAIDKCKTLTPSTEWMMLTGYSEFNYAREALRLGVTDYLLKPVGLKELSEVIAKTSENIKQRLDKQNHSFALSVLSMYNTSLIGDLYDSFDSSDESSSVLKTSLACYETFIFYIDTWNKEERYQLLTRLNASLNAICLEMMDCEFRYALFYLSSGELCLVIYNSKRTMSICAFLTEFITSCKEPVTVFYCKQADLKQVSLSCQRISEVSSIRLVYKLGTIIKYDELPQNKDFKSLSELANTLEKLCLAFIEGEEIEYKNILDELSKNTQFKSVFLEATGANTEKYLKAALDLDLSINSYASLLKQLLAHSGAMYRHHPKKTSVDVISQIKDYINDHYMKEIGINSIAERYDITPNYLSKIFHQKVGKKFIDYLTEVRIINAKRLFAENPDMPVKEVSILVGYYSTRHFTKVFSKIVGCLPSEYQKQLTLRHLD